jgi:hypothetical protein
VGCTISLKAAVHPGHKPQTLYRRRRRRRRNNDETLMNLEGFHWEKNLLVIL